MSLVILFKFTVHSEIRDHREFETTGNTHAISQASHQSRYRPVPPTTIGTRPFARTASVAALASLKKSPTLYSADFVRAGWLPFSAGDRTPPETFHRHSIDIPEAFQRRSRGVPEARKPSTFQRHSRHMNSELYARLVLQSGNQHLL